MHSYNDNHFFLGRPKAGRDTLLLDPIRTTFTENSSGYSDLSLFQIPIEVYTFTKNPSGYSDLSLFQILIEVYTFTENPLGYSDLSLFKIGIWM